MSDAGDQWMARSHPFQRRNTAMLVDANGYLFELARYIVRSVRSAQG